MEVAKHLHSVLDVGYIRAFYFHIHAVKIHHRDEYNAECEKDTAQFMVQLFICGGNFDRYERRKGC